MKCFYLDEVRRLFKTETINQCLIKSKKEQIKDWLEVQTFADAESGFKAPDQLIAMIVHHVCKPCMPVLKHTI